MRLPVELDRPLAFLDLETTGLSTKDDRIVEMAIIKVSPQGAVLEKVRRFNPEMPIPKAASAIHGIYDDDVKDEALFRTRARSLFEQLDPCDLAGFNIRRYDLPLLVAEFKRAGIVFTSNERRVIDMQAIFHTEERRDLSAAAKFYLEREHQEAHTALGDIRTTAAVLVAQLERYPHIPQTMDGLQAYCDKVFPLRIGLGQWFTRKDDVLVFSKGKHNGRELSEIARLERGYLQWMLGLKDMEDEVLDVIHKALQNDPSHPPDAP